MHQTASNLSWIEEIHSTTALSSNHELNKEWTILPPPTFTASFFFTGEFLGTWVVTLLPNQVEMLCNYLERDKNLPNFYYVCNFV